MSSESTKSSPNKTSKPNRKAVKISARCQTNAYLSAAAAGSFLSAFFIYVGYDVAAIFSTALSLLSFPVLALQDRVIFDGKRIYRSGLLWRLYSMVNKNRTHVKPKEIVHVETQTLRTFRRGSNVTYRYRTSLQTRDISFRIGSGRGFRKMILTLLPLVSESCLDLRSVELRDHLQDTAEIAAHVRSLKIPRTDVLDASSILSRTERRSAVTNCGESDNEKAEELRALANQLRTSGKLLQSLEAFRRALRLSPANGRLIYEIARCLQSLASSQHDKQLERKAQAMLRLAELRSADDGDLLSRLGETYFSLGLWKRAEQVFRRAADSGLASYRTLRGLGELALRDGKIAHAINHFYEASKFAGRPPLFRWAESEAEYLRRLNEDDEYMDIEIGRINLFDTFEGARRTSMRIFVFGLAVIFVGFAMSTEVMTNVGWAVSGLSLLIWIGSSIVRLAFASRIPFEMVRKD